MYGTRFNDIGSHKKLKTPKTTKTNLKRKSTTRFQNPKRLRRRLILTRDLQNTLVSIVLYCTRAGWCARQWSIVVDDDEGAGRREFRPLRTARFFSTRRSIFSGGNTASVLCGGMPGAVKEVVVLVKEVTGGYWLSDPNGEHDAKAKYVCAKRRYWFSSRFSDTWRRIDAIIIYT